MADLMKCMSTVNEALKNALGTIQAQDCLKYLKYLYYWIIGIYIVTWLLAIAASASQIQVHSKYNLREEDNNLSTQLNTMNAFFIIFLLLLGGAFIGLQVMFSKYIPLGN